MNIMCMFIPRPLFDSPIDHAMIFFSFRYSMVMYFLPFSKIQFEHEFFDRELVPKTKLLLILSLFLAFVLRTWYCMLRINPEFHADFRREEIFQN